jgi:Mn2+/Fe2+ NRAMP family transporter
LELDIITVILAAQVANGLLLPFIAGIVLVFANDRGLLGDDVNAWWQNGLGFLVATFLAQKNATLLLDKVGIEGIWPGIIAAGVYGLLLVWLMGRRQSV